MRDYHPVNVCLAECSGNRQVTNEKHDGGREHGGGYVSGQRMSMALEQGWHNLLGCIGRRRWYKVFAI